MLENEEKKPGNSSEIIQPDEAGVSKLLDRNVRESVEGALREGAKYSMFDLLHRRADFSDPFAHV